LVCVAPALDCRSAARIAARAGVHRLLVVDGGALVGIVCRHDLALAPEERVGRRMREEVYVIAAAATLGEAAAAMRTLGVGCLPVVREGQLVGILTRGDLVCCGVPEEELAPGKPAHAGGAASG
jgi:CBS domain-containing protein